MKGIDLCRMEKVKYRVPVVVHVANEHGVEGVEVSAEHGKLVQDEQLSLLVVAFTVGLQQLLLSHNLQVAVQTVKGVLIRHVPCRPVVEGALTDCILPNPE